MSARRSTVSVSRRKPHSPRTYWSGSRAARRPTSARAASSSRRLERAVELHVEIDPRDAERVREEQLGVEPRRVRSVRREVLRRAPQDVAEVVRAGQRTARVAQRDSSGHTRGLEGAAAVLGLERVGELLEVAVEDLVEAVDRVLDAVVGEPVLGEVVGADLLRALARPDLRAPGRRLLRLLALALGLVEARAEHAHRLLLVLELRLLVLHRDDDPARDVRDPHGGVGRVDGLAARPGRAVDVDLQVLVLDRDLDLLGLGHHGDRRGRGVDPALRLGRGHALDAMRAALPLEDGERAVALDREDGLLDAAAVVLVRGEELGAVAAPLGVALQHA